MALELTELDDLSGGLIFRRRPISIPGDLRPVWRIGLIVILLSRCCRGGKTSLARLHVLSWASRTEQARASLRAALGGTKSPDSLVVRFEPALNRAVDFARGEGLVRRVDGNKIELTDAGRALVKEIDDDKEAFAAEKAFAAELGFKVTEKIIDHIFGAKS